MGIQRRVRRFLGGGFRLHTGEPLAHDTVAHRKLCGDSVRPCLRHTEEHADAREHTFQLGGTEDYGEDGDVLLVRVHGVHDKRGGRERLRHRQMVVPAGMLHRVLLDSEQHTETEGVYAQLQGAGVFRNREAVED